jgi:hypothetical protein
MIALFSDKSQNSSGLKYFTIKKPEENFWLIGGSGKAAVYGGVISFR